MSHAEPVSAELRLVQRCLDGDEAAWRDLFECYQPQLLAYVADRLGPVPGRQELTQEVVGRFWVALLARGRHRLRSFDPGRGRLAQFLFAIATQQLVDVVRARRGRRPVTKPVIHRNAPAEGPLSPEALLAEFEPRLTAGERRFYREQLLGQPSGEPPAVRSEVAFRKMKQRVRAKFRAFLAGA